MKILKRIFLTIIIFTIVGIFFRSWIYQYLVTYKSVGIRTSYSAKDKKLIAFIDANTNKLTNPNIRQLIQLGLSITTKQLNFTANKNDIDPNKLITSKTAHCLGYASFYTATCNYLLNRYNLDDKWIAKPHIGQLYVLGTNIHKYSNSLFFKDHDFVTIENKITGEIFAVDPTVNDYFYIDIYYICKMTSNSSKSKSDK